MSCQERYGKPVVHVHHGPLLVCVWLSCAGPQVVGKEDMRMLPYSSLHPIACVLATVFGMRIQTQYCGG